VRVLKASDYVINNLSGNFEMREGAFRLSAVIFFDEHSIAVQHLEACVGSLHVVVNVTVVRSIIKTCNE
jgi:hypothetical protein